MGASFPAFVFCGSYGSWLGSDLATLDSVHERIDADTPQQRHNCSCHRGYTIGGTLADLAGFTLVNSSAGHSVSTGRFSILWHSYASAWLPESPLYLVGAGRILEAREVMQIIAPDRSIRAITRDE